MTIHVCSLSHQRNVQGFGLGGFFSPNMAIFIASSKTFLRFFWTIAEHSMYFTTLTPLLFWSLINFLTCKKKEIWFRYKIKLSLLIRLTYRLLIHDCQSLLLQTFKFSRIFSEVGLRPDQYNGSFRTVMVDLRDPLGLHVPETGGAGDWETDQENIL